LSINSPRGDFKVSKIECNSDVESSSVQKSLMNDRRCFFRWKNA